MWVNSLGEFSFAINGQDAIKQGLFTEDRNECSEQSHWIPFRAETRLSGLFTRSTSLESRFAMRAERFVEPDHTTRNIKAQIGVYIINDQAIFRAGLRMLLEDAGMAVLAEAANRVDAVAMAKASIADVILLDIDFVTDNGLDILGELVSVSTGPVLVLTGSASLELHQLAVQNGARGIVLKEEPPEILAKAIRQVDSGELWLRRSLLTELITRQRAGSPSRQRNQDPETQKIAMLTPRERDIVGLVAEGLNGRGIADKLRVSEFTVRNHLTSILDKLDLSNKFELAVYAFRHSLVNQTKEPSL